jgi:hypothetical protein
MFGLDGFASDERKPVRVYATCFTDAVNCEPALRAHARLHTVLRCNPAELPREVRLDYINWILPREAESVGCPIHVPFSLSVNLCK